jgi:signal transduction histidine kinase
MDEENCRRSDFEASEPTADELRDLAMHQEAEREEERTRISREIHDLLGQDLTALKLDLAWMRQRIPPGNEAVARKIEAMTALVDSTAKTVRRISAQLRPSMLDDLGLAEAVLLHMREFEERTGIASRVNVPEKGMPGNRRIATAFFRILQEALSNVVRHAGAGKVEVTLDCDGRSGTLRVADDGKGILPGQLRNHKAFGIMAIRERVAALGGTLSIVGEAGKGTVIEVTVPCTKGEDCRC